MPIDYEAFGDLGGVCTMQDGRKLMPWGKQPGNLGVHGHLLVLFVPDDGGSAEEVEELVYESHVPLTRSEARLEGDQACSEVDFSDALIRIAMADGDVPDMTEQRVQQL